MWSNFKLTRVKLTKVMVTVKVGRVKVKVVAQGHKVKRVKVIGQGRRLKVKGGVFGPVRLEGGATCGSLGECTLLFISSALILTSAYVETYSG